MRQGFLVVRSFVLVVGLGVAPLAWTQTEVIAPPGLRLEPCEIRGVAAPVSCGTLEVLENRALPQGRRIALRVVVLGATSKPRESDPLFFLAGGPGDAASRRAAGVGLLYREVRQHRDIVLVDQRGTGASNSLAFDAAGPSPGLERYFAEFLSPETVRAAKTRLETSADLTLYHTPAAIEDLDAVRAALGYERVNLAGSSYGTRAAMAYLRRFPERTRSVVLFGVSRFDDHLPVHMPASGQRALDLLLAECEGEIGCKAAFPDLRDEARTLFDTLASGPLNAKVLNPLDGEVATVSIGRDAAALAVQYMLYSPAFAAQLPAVIHQAARGDYGPLAEMTLFARMNMFGQVSAGMYLSVLCSEDLPGVTAEEAERAAAGTFLGTSRYENMRSLCALWPRGELPEEYFEPVRSDAPVLVLSGELDPATPPDNGAYVARHLPNSLNLVIPHAGHEVDGLANASCLFALVNRFVETGTVKDLDASSCLEGISRPPFPTREIATAVVDLADQDLARFAGTWSSPEASFEVVIERRDRRLQLTLPGQPALLLAPVSPNRFKVVGPPGVYVTFDLEGATATRAAVEQAGVETYSFVPKFHN